MLVLHGKAVELAEAEPMEPFQRVEHRRVGDAGVSPPLADESAAANLPTEWDEKREVEAEEKRLPQFCRVARAQC